MTIDEARLTRLRIEPLDRAKQADQDFTKTYVVVEPPSSRILGYYAPCTHTIDIRTLPEQDRKRMPHLRRDKKIGWL